MISRYERPEMAAVFSDTARFGRWLEIERLATEAWADGRVTREELDLMKAVAKRAGLGDYDVDQIVKGARTRLYHESAQALRDKRGNGG